MIYPQGKIIYENLSTSFTNLEELLIELKAEHQTGYVHVSYWDYDGALFLDNGKIINAIAETKGQRITGLDAVSGVMEKSREKEGTISVHSLPSDVVTLLASVANSDAIHQGLTTEFTNLTGLFEKLHADGHTGFIEIVLQNSGGVGMVFFQEGDPVTSILSRNGESSSGPNMLQKIVEMAMIQGATFNVYRADLAASIAEGAEMMAGFELPTLLELWGDILASAERITDSRMGQGIFIKTFNEIRIQHADSHPFLDPFAAEFDYREGAIDVRNASVRQINNGLAACLTDTIETLTAQKPKADIHGSVREAIMHVKESRAETIAKFQLESVLTDLLG
jgi:hypothetical protein